MSIDVDSLLAQYEQAPTNEPMHGQRGQVRRQPSSDQKRERRRITVQKKAEAEQAAETGRTVAQLLRRASVAPTMAEQQELMAQVEQLRTAQLSAHTAGRELDLSVTESVEIVPRGMHELHTASTDWLAEDGLSVTASASDAERALVVQATLWFERVPDYVKEDAQEFGIQAQNLARRTASAYGDQAEVAVEAFVREAQRLYRLGQRTGSITTLASIAEDPFSMPENDRFAETDGVNDPYPRPDNQAPYGTDPHEEPKDQPHLDAAVKPDNDSDSWQHPLINSEIDKHMSGHDADGVRDMARGYAQHVVSGSLQHTASLAVQDDDLSAALAGFEVTAGPLLALPEIGEAAEAIGGGAEAEGAGAGKAPLSRMPGMPGGGEGGHGGGADGGSGQGVGDMGAEYAHSVIGASQVPQVGSYGPGGTDGYPAATFPSFNQGGAGGLGQSGAEPSTSSNKSPALQELQNFTGWDGSSVVPQGPTDAAAENNDTEGTRDDSMAPAGFPVSGSYNHQKESSMDHAACPTCSGTGHVAVRKMAYSGLPQIDQIVSADETPDQSPAPGQAEHYPSEVAFPLTGWGATPEQGGQNIQNAISQAEGQVSDRNARSPLVTGTTASQYQANGRDNSGWLGDMGAKGTDYPGNSTPDYDGSNNLGQPDPVYGYGGDNGNQPLRPYGEMESNDETNNPSEPFEYGATHDDAQAYRTVSPGLSTAGSQDPFIAQAQAEQARLANVIATRQRQLAQGR